VKAGTGTGEQDGARQNGRDGDMGIGNWQAKDKHQRYSVLMRPLFTRSATYVS